MQHFIINDEYGIRYPAGHIDPVDSEYQRRVFGPQGQQLWDRITTLASSDFVQAIKIASRLRDCCRNPQVVVVDDPPRYYLRERRCKSRVCPRCATIRAKTLANRISDLIHHMDAPRFLTLTIRSNDQPLALQITHLRRRFGAMRRTPIWKRHVKQGVYTIEVTYNAHKAQWHPHLHAIIDGHYWPQPDLLDTWQSIVHDHAGVDIRAVHGVRKLANYLATYVAKSCDLSQLPPEKVAEWAVQTHGLRLAQTFGGLQNCKPQTEPPEPKEHRILPVNVNRMAFRASCGDQNAEQVLRTLAPLPHPCDQLTPEEVGGRLLAYVHRATNEPPPEPTSRPPPDPLLF